MILKYLKSAPRKGLLFKKNFSIEVEAFTNVDYVGPLDDNLYKILYFL